MSGKMVVAFGGSYLSNVFWCIEKSQIFRNVVNSKINIGTVLGTY